MGPPSRATLLKALRIGGVLLVLAATFAYIVVKVDFGKAATILRHAQISWVVAAVGLLLAMVLPMAWRWRLLLAVRGIHEPLPWLVRTYLVSLAIGQVLPTSVGGDASRVYETQRRHRDRLPSITGSVLVERATGGIVTLGLAAVGFVLAVGRYPIGAYLWVEVLLTLGALVFAIVFFSRRMRARLVRLVPLTRALRVERISRGLYEGVHGYRDHAAALATVAVATVVVQFGGILAIYAAGRAVGLHVSLVAYVVFGPLLFLVTLIPFTINGLGVREAFFVDFFVRLHVAPDAAFACGFLFFLASLLIAVPGLLILMTENIRRAPVGSSAA